MSSDNFWRVNEIANTFYLALESVTSPPRACVFQLQ